MSLDKCLSLCFLKKLTNFWLLVGSVLLCSGFLAAFVGGNTLSCKSAYVVFLLCSEQRLLTGASVVVSMWAY